MKRLQLMLLGCAAFGALGGCGAPIVVDAQAAQSIQSLGIISVFSNRVPYNMQHDGPNVTDSLARAGKAWGRPGGNNPISFGKDDLVRYARKAYHRALSQVSGWQVIELNEQPAYQRWAAKHDAQAGWQVLPGSRAMELSKEDAAETLSPLRDLARELKLDAVAVIQLDLAYEPWTAFHGMGNAKASVGHSVKIVTTQGVYAVATEDIERGGGERQRSDGRMGLVGGGILYSNEAASLYKQAIDKLAASLPGRIRAALK